MRNLALWTVVLGLAGSTAAQPTWTAPKPLHTTDGNSSNTSWLGYSNRQNTTIQHTLLDATNTGAAKGIKAVWWRRDAAIGSYAAGIARRTTLEIRMGHGDFKKAEFGKFIQHKQVLLGSWTTVFTNKQIGMPSWVNKIGSASPQPYTMKAALDRPFAYDGKNAIIVNWKGWNQDTGSNNARHPADFQRGPRPYSFKTGTNVGRGCRAGGQSRDMYCYGYWYVYPSGQQSRLLVQNLYGPKATPLIVFFGAAANQSFPGLCTNVYTSMAANDVLTSGSNSGHAGKNYTFNHQVGYLGARFNIQVVGLDATQTGLPIAASRGYRVGAYPAPPPPSTLMYAHSHTTTGHGGSRPPQGWPFVSVVYYNRGSALPTGME